MPRPTRKAPTKISKPTSTRASKPTRTKTATPEPSSHDSNNAGASEDGSDAGYQTAPDEEEYQVLLKQIKAGVSSFQVSRAAAPFPVEPPPLAVLTAAFQDQRKKEAGRKRRMAKFEADMDALRAAAQGMAPPGESAA